MNNLATTRYWVTPVTNTHGGSTFFAAHSMGNLVASNAIALSGLAADPSSAPVTFVALDKREGNRDIWMMNPRNTDGMVTWIDAVTMTKPVETVTFMISVLLALAMTYSLCNLSGSARGPPCLAPYRA
jgi:hypothetical protein